MVSSTSTKVRNTTSKETANNKSSSLVARRFFESVKFRRRGLFTHRPRQEVGFGPKSRGTDGKPTNEMGLYSRKTQNLTGSCNSPLFFSRIGSDSRLLRIAYGLLSVRVYKACPQASLDQSGEWKIAAPRYQLIRAASNSIDATCVWALTFFG